MKYCLSVPLMVILCSAITISCKSPRYMYTAPAQNIPLLKEKGDSKAAAYYSSAPGLSGKDLLFPQVSSYSRGIDLQGAYAFTDHFAGMLNYSRRWERNGSKDDVVYKDSVALHYKRSMTELGGGYFTPMNSRGSSYFQAFAGVAFGKSTLKDEKISGGGLKNHSANVTRFFIQPVFTKYSSENVAVSFSTRFSFVNFSNIQTDYNDEEKTAYQLDDLEKGVRTFWEPTLSVSFGINRFPGIRMELQSGMSALLSQRYIATRDINLSVGFTFDFGLMKNGR